MGKNPNAQKPDMNAPEVLKKCSEEKCTQKGIRAGFCTEHFTWYKEGMLTNEGKKPRDFDKKYQAFMQRQKQAA